MIIRLLDGSLELDIYFDKDEAEFDDDVYISFREPCPDDERIFRADETNIALTPKEAMRLAKALIDAAEKSLEWRETNSSDD